MKRKARVLVAGLAAASMLAFGGCSVRAQTGFTVNGDVTSMSTITDTINGCATAFGEIPSDLSAASVVDAMIVAQISRDMAKQMNAPASDSDLGAMIQTGQIQGLTPSMMSDPACGSLAVGMAWQMLLASQMGSASFLTAVQSYDVTVNPRFGTWDPTKLSLSGSGSLSQPAN